MPFDPVLTQYYAARAHEYERVYQKPERQEELALLRDHVRDLLDGRDVLEIACGTGYWTEILMRSVKSVVATDVTEAVLAIANSKPIDRSRATFRPAEAELHEAIHGLTLEPEVELLRYYWLLRYVPLAPA